MNAVLPSATLLHLTEREAVIFAARACYDSFFQKNGEPRTPEQDAQLLTRIRDLDHLSVTEHAVWTFRGPPIQKVDLLDTLFQMDRPPTYRPTPGHWGTYQFNATQLRSLSTLSVYGRVLIDLVRDAIPEAFADITPRADYEVPTVSPFRLRPEWAFDEAERRVFPIRQFHIRCSRATSHQLVRHRTLSPEQRSQRFVDEGEAQYIPPPSYWAKGESASRARTALDESVRASLAAYRALRDVRHDHTGKPLYRKGDARAILPNCLETQLIVTGNAHAWRLFLARRLARDAQEEIRWIGIQILRALQASLPGVFDDLTGETNGLEPWLAHQEESVACPV